MADLLNDIAEFIISNNYATAIGSDIYLDYRPDGPDNIIVVNEYIGTPIEYTEAAIRRLQIQVRNKNSNDARLLINNLYRMFNENIIYENLPNNRYGIVSPTSTPTILTTDEENRTIYYFNLSITTKID
jgi:hypothetical protein